MNPIRPWFLPDARRDAVDRIARSWEGTPFFPHAASRGKTGGVDCVNYVHEVLVETGVIPRQTLPDYTLDHARHNPHSQLLRWLLAATAGPEPGFGEKTLILVPPRGHILPGDLFAIRTGLLDHHLAVAIHHAQVAHAIEGAGVTFTDQDDWRLQERILYVARIMEVRGQDVEQTAPVGASTSMLDVGRSMLDVREEEAAT
ncbi:hypothetical protein [Geminisphaera colitermitum]|uniref:hypothetical protein n=1 Tax=Geminisphaera colitermitum TaxID=1148786 RepID=UPI000158C4FE|nr:hypothetical protein [Geminisphaera colitermitum]